MSFKPISRGLKSDIVIIDKTSERQLYQLDALKTRLNGLRFDKQLDKKDLVKP